MELNKVRNIGGKIVKIRFAIGLLIIGAIFAAIGGFITFNNFGKNVTYCPVEAEVVELSPFESDQRVKVKYSIDGTDYEVEIPLTNGSIGQKVTIYYDESNPNNTSTSQNGSIVVPIVVMVVGVVAIAGGVILLVTTIKNKNSNQFEQVDMSKVSQYQIDEVKDNNEPLKDYYFHYGGKMNQSYVLETLDREPVITMNCNKVGIVSKSKFTFKNVLTGRSTDYEVGHTITLSYGSGNYSIPTKSSFKMNGEDVFELIGKKGYSIISKIEGLKLNFDICKYGIKVAELRAGGANVAKGGNSSLGNLPTRGVFSVNAKESDLDMVALIAFAVSRVDFF